MDEPPIDAPTRDPDAPTLDGAANSANEGGTQTIADGVNRASGHDAAYAPHGSPRPYAVGAKLGRYIVLDQLGRGAMGIVYSAYDPDLDRRVAIKVLLPSAAAGTRGTNARARLVREAQAIARVAHPHVIAVHDVGIEAMQVFLAMEFVPGRDLAKWLETPQPIDDVVRVFGEAGEGLHAAHQAGLVHGDFKPANVLLGDDGRARVVDFGLVRLGEPPSLGSGLPSDSTSERLPAGSTQASTVVGTPAYMAPEQFCGVPGNDRSDQFSFCVALYEGLYCGRPFGGESIVTIARAVTLGQFNEPRTNPGVSHLI